MSNVIPQDFIKHEVENEGDWSEWVNPNLEQYFMKCCDCGLVHEMQFKVVKYSEGDECEFVADVDLQAVFRARRATPSAAPVQEPDWKAEYLKSVESGCTTLDELREARAELDATNRQVEILSDALAESWREVAALKAVQEDWGPGPHEVHSLPPAQPAPVQEPVELVRIEHWRQDTMESGRWEKTREMPRHITERLLHHFDQASIITAAAPEKGQS